MNKNEFTDAVELASLRFRVSELEETTKVLVSLGKTLSLAVAKLSGDKTLVQGVQEVLDRMPT